MPFSVESLFSILTPITIFTALLMYFGYTTTRSYFGYYGIGQGLLGLSTDGYVLRSADVTFGSAVRLLSILTMSALADLWLHRFLRRSASPIPARVAVFVGAALTIAGLYFALGGPRPSWLPPVALPATLGVGALVLLRWTVVSIRVSDAQLERTISVNERKALVLLLVASTLMATFWAATIYAVDRGRGAAQADDRFPDRLPLVTIFSDEFVDLTGSAVEVRRYEQPEPHYRYLGLRLLAYSNERWFLLTGRYDDGHVSAVTVLPDSESVRVEIAERR
jgi:hypothetical protein